MKVICINNSPGQYAAANRMLSVGQEYSASDSPINGYYDVAGLLFDPVDGARIVFKKTRFIPLSSIDETEFERNYKKEPEWIEAFNKITIKPKV